MKIERSRTFGPVLLLIAAAAFALVACGQDAAPSSDTPSTAAPSEAADKAEEAAGAPRDSSRGGAPLEASEVGGLPVYPGLVVASKSDGMTTDDGGKTLPAVVTFAHGQTMDEVVAFYVENLEGWQQAESWGNQVFYQGEPDEEFDLMAEEFLMRPSIAVMPPIRDDDAVRVQYIYEGS